MKPTIAMCVTTDPFVAHHMSADGGIVYGYGATREEAIADRADIAQQLGYTHQLVVYQRTDKQVKRRHMTWQVYERVD